MKVRGVGASRLGTDLLHRRRQLLFLAAGQHDPPTEPSHLARNRKPDPRSATGDDAGAPLERFLWKHSDDSPQPRSYVMRGVAAERRKRGACSTAAPRLEDDATFISQ